MTVRARLWLVLSTLVVACATGGRAPPPSDARPLATGDPLPDLVLRSLFSGDEIRLASLRGKVLLLDIWASWCVPCKEELPLLDALAQRLADQGVEVLAVSVDETRAPAEAFLETRPRWSLTVAHDPRGLVAERLQPAKMPTAYLVDDQGVVRYVNSGYRPGDAAILEARLRELAAARR